MAIEKMNGMIVRKVEAVLAPITIEDVQDRNRFAWRAGYFR